jgi:uncharacterized protein
MSKTVVMLRSVASAMRLEARKAGAAFAVLLAAAAFASVAHAAPLTFPALTGRVVDDAHVLPPATVASLEDKLKGLQDQTSRQLVVVTLPSLQGDDIADYGYQLGRKWGVGQKGTNNGALFIVVPSEHKVRIEVGYGMEGILTDALTSVILQTQVLPAFKAGDIPGGVTAGADAIIQQMSADPSTAEQKAADAAAQQAQLQQQSYSHHRSHSPISGVFSIIFFAFVMISIFGRMGRRGGGGGLWPLLFLGGMMGGGGRGDDDWGGGGGGGGGGGFSGGGGSFGGGGSSGSW